MCADNKKTPIVERGDHIHLVTDEQGDTRVTRIEKEYTFAFELRQVARVMRKRARETPDCSNTHWELRAYIFGSIMFSYASLEAALNEIIHLSALSEDSPLNEEERKVFHTIGEEELEPSGYSDTLKKFNMLLRILDKPEMSPGEEPYQSANLVRELRNKFVHPIPGRVVTYLEGDPLDYSSQQKIIRKLKAVLGLTESAVFPDAVLTPECAEWAVRSCEAFLHEFTVRSGIHPGFITDPDHPRTS